MPLLLFKLLADIFQLEFVCFHYVFTLSNDGLNA